MKPDDQLQQRVIKKRITFQVHEEKKRKEWPKTKGGMVGLKKGATENI